MTHQPGSFKVCYQSRDRRFADVPQCHLESDIKLSMFLAQHIAQWEEERIFEDEQQTSSLLLYDTSLCNFLHHVQAEFREKSNLSVVDRAELQHSQRWEDVWQ